MARRTVHIDNEEWHYKITPSLVIIWSPNNKKTVISRWSIRGYCLDCHCCRNSCCRIKPSKIKEMILLVKNEIRDKSRDRNETGSVIAY